MDKLYFAGLIRGGREDVTLYRRIIQELGKYEDVLTEHVGYGIAKKLFCCHRKRTAEYGQSLSAVSGHKRYNTLDFAEQNRVPKAGHPASLWKSPGYRQKAFLIAARKCFLTVFIFPTYCKIE